MNTTNLLKNNKYNLSYFYLILAILGAILPMISNFHFAYEYGFTFDIKKFIQLANDNFAAESISRDLFDEELNRIDKIVKSVQERLETMNDIKEKYNYDLGRVYIGGYSQGAIMAYKLALLYPDTFSGVVIHSARLPVKYSPKSPSTLYENMDMLIIH